MSVSEKFLKIRVEVWYLDESVGLWKFWNEVALEDWLVENGRLLSEINSTTLNRYQYANWIAWKDDTRLPLPAAIIDRVERVEKERMIKMDKMDLTGPYGFERLDNEVVG